MATSTALISSIIIPLLAALFSLIGGLGGGYVVWKLNKNDEKYQKLYGPLRFELLMMKLAVENREEVLKDIKEWLNVETQINLMQKHMSPLTKRWLSHRDKIRKLFEENAGFIKKRDFNLVSDFMDGCIKREIIEEGTIVLAVNETRTNRLLEAVAGLQERLL